MLVGIDTASRAAPWLTQKGMLRVPEITVVFWVIKGLSTALGESASDFLVHAMAPELAVVLGFAGFVFALFAAVPDAPLRRVDVLVRRGDGRHLRDDGRRRAARRARRALRRLERPRRVRAAVVFVAWQRTEHTLSIHSIDTPRREAFYWATVAATFAMGTALGDFTAYTLHLGYFTSALLVRGRDRRRRGRVPLVALERGAVVLARVRHHPAARRVPRRRIREADTDGGLGIGNGPVVLVLGRADPRARHLPRGHARRRAARPDPVE